MTLTAVSYTVASDNSGEYDDFGDYYPFSSAEITGTAIETTDVFVAFNAATIEQLAQGLSDLTVTVSFTLQNDDFISNQTINVEALTLPSGEQQTVEADKDNGSGLASGNAYVFEDLKNASYLASTSAGVKDSTVNGSINVTSAAATASAAGQDLFITFTTGGAGTTYVSNVTLTVSGIEVTNLPVISGTVADQTILDDKSTTPFSSVALSDPGNPGGPGDDVLISILNPLGVATAQYGTLSLPTAVGQAQGVVLSSKGTGQYELTGPFLANIQTALESLVFTPTSLGTGPSPVAATFQLTVQDQGGIGGSTNNSGTSVIISHDSAACFCRGTHVLTPGGEVPVERLSVGDLVTTADGRSVPLAWIGSRRITAQTRLDRDIDHPVRIRRDAIAPGVPHRDLLVTGDHAVFVDGLLIPARLLVNGGSICAERSMTDYTIHHLELARHDLLLAEGLPSESYLDTGNRHAFAGDNVRTLAAPGGASAADCYRARGVAPLALDAPSVEPVWRRLADRAARLGLAKWSPPATGDRGDLHVQAGGRRIAASCVIGNRHLFAVPAGTARVVLASASARPSDARPWVDDRRLLGVLVSRIRLVGEQGPADIALDGTALGRGWHGLEAGARWTDGAAELALTGGCILELTVASDVAAPSARRLAA